MLHLKLRFPSQLVDQAGAPETAWLVIHSPPDSQQLHLTVAWQNKTVTRLPEAMWLKFTPGEGAVDEGSWRMRKLNSHIDPKEVGAEVGVGHALRGTRRERDSHTERGHEQAPAIPLKGNLGNLPNTGHVRKLRNEQIQATLRCGHQQLIVLCSAYDDGRCATRRQDVYGTRRQGMDLACTFLVPTSCHCHSSPIVVAAAACCVCRSYAMAVTPCMPCHMA